MGKVKAIFERIPPMLATSGKGPFDSADWVFEIKWDGTRCIVATSPTELVLYNRRLTSILSRFPELAALSTLPSGCVLDGEVVVFVEGKPSFFLNQKRQMTEAKLKAEILSGKYPATFVAWDLLYQRGESLMDRPLYQRRTALKQFLNKHKNPYIVLTDQIEGKGVDYFAAVERMGLEGLIAKRRESKYLPGARSKNWLKIKAWRTEKFTVIGYTENRRLHAVSGVLLGEKRAGGEWFYRGSVGSGFPVEDRRALLEALATAPELPNPPADGPKEAKWRGIGLHCRVMFLEETASGRLRSPVFKGWVR